MTDTKNHVAGMTGSLEGRVFTPSSTAEITEAVELAFDYRGDVTLTLRSGETVTGYIYNRQVAVAESYLELFPGDRPDAQRIPYSEITTIAFTGDTLSGANATANRQMVGNSCANCHVKIHGTNHPSGARLQR